MGKRNKETFLKKAEPEYHKNIRVLSKRFALFSKTKRFDFEIS